MYLEPNRMSMMKLFFRKYLTAFGSYVFSHKSSIVNLRLGFKDGWVHITAPNLQ